MLSKISVPESVVEVKNTAGDVVLSADLIDLRILWNQCVVGNETNDDEFCRAFKRAIVKDYGVQLTTSQAWAILDRVPALYDEWKKKVESDSSFSERSPESTSSRSPKETPSRSKGNSKRSKLASSSATATSNPAV